MSCSPLHCRAEHCVQSHEPLHLLQELINVGADLGEQRQPPGEQLAGCWQVQTRDGKDAHHGLGGREGWPVDQLPGLKSSGQGAKGRRPVIREQREKAGPSETPFVTRGSGGEQHLVGVCPTGWCAALREPSAFVRFLLGLLGLQLK